LYSSNIKLWADHGLTIGHGP